MADTTSTDAGLTRDQIRALRNAEYVTFRWQCDPYDPGALGTTTIVATKRENPGDGFGERELRVEIPLQFACYAIYDGGGPGTRLESASWSVWNYRATMTPLRTFLGLLKTGDRIVPDFMIGNSTEAMRAVDMTLDVLRVQIRRGQHDPMLFCLEQMVLAPHSLSRHFNWTTL